MHDEYRELLIKYHNGTCTEEEKEVIKEHLKACSECKKAWMEMQFEISYEPDVNTAVEQGAEEIASNEAEKKVKKKFNKRSQIAVGVIVIVLVLGLLGATNYFAEKARLINLSKEFVLFYSESFSIPEEYRNGSDDELWGNVHTYKKGLRNIMLNYYAEDNKTFEENYENVEYILDGQVDGYIEMGLFDAKYEIVDTEVRSMTLKKAKVFVRVSDGSAEKQYEIQFVSGDKEWKIESFKQQLTEDMAE